MSYLGQVELKSSEIRRIDVTGSTSATHTLTWTPASEQSLIITINGIKQQNNYSISGTTLTLDDALLSADEMEVIGILDIGEAVVPPDDSITNAMVKSDAAIAQSKLATLAIDTAELADDAVTAAKLANSINTEIAANTAKVTNATHTGDVTGATALTIAADAVDIAMLSATGTASATTFLRGDNAWAAAGGNNTPAFHANVSGYTSSWSAGTWTLVPFDVETFDTDSDFDLTADRFTPTTAGKYYVYGQVTGSANSGNLTQTGVRLEKNGVVQVKNQEEFRAGSLSADVEYKFVAAIIDMNGSSDYLECWGLVNAASGTYVLSGYTTNVFFGAFRLL